MKNHFDYIDSEQKLATFSRQLKTAEWVAVDTEFMRERTYFAKLALLQIASEHACALIDVPAIGNIDALKEVFVSEKCIKIMHSASQDIEVLFQTLGVMPAPLFDTQLAASLLGEADHISYANIVLQRLGVVIEKDQTRTNWLRRPLSDAQLKYAEVDVLHLHEIYTQLQGELNSKARLEWVWEEAQDLSDKTRLSLQPDIAWKRLKGITRLSVTAQRAAIALSTWREQRAQQKDLPREWVLKKQVLFAIAIAQPETFSALTRIDGLTEKQIHAIGKPILAALQKSQGAKGIGALPQGLIPEQRAWLKKLSALVRQIGEQEKIAPALLASRTNIEQLITGEGNLPILSGWRKQVVGMPLVSLLDKLQNA